MSDTSEQDDDNDSDSEIPKRIKAVDRYLASEIDSSEFSAAMRGSSNDTQASGSSSDALIIIPISDNSSVASEAPQTSRFARTTTGGKEPGKSRRSFVPRFSVKRD